MRAYDLADDLATMKEFNFVLMLWLICRLKNGGWKSASERQMKWLGVSLGKSVWKYSVSLLGTMKYAWAVAQPDQNFGSQHDEG